MSVRDSIIIIGSGICGLVAARELARKGKKVTVLEALPEPGGRIRSIEKDKHRFEAGAEFVHGNLPLTFSLVGEAGLETVVSGGAVWQFKGGRLQEQEGFMEHGEELGAKLEELKNDMSVKSFLEQEFGGAHHEDLRREITRFVEGYDAADAGKASALTLAKELDADEDQYRIKGGYGPLVSFMEQECRQSGVTFFFSQPVREVTWKKGEVEVKTEEGQVYKAEKLLCTFSLGLWQQDPTDPTSIAFFPELKEKRQLARQFGFGPVIKFLLLFRDAFWEKDHPGMGFLFSQEAVPTWWTQAPGKSPLLTGWLAGPAVLEYTSLSEGEKLELAIGSLSRIFDLPASTDILTGQRTEETTLILSAIIFPATRKETG